MEISNTLIKHREKRKTNSALVETIEIARKKGLLELAKRLSGPTRKQTKINIGELSRLKEKDLMVVGKVLGEGEIEHKLKISALAFSKQAMEKLKKAGCEIKIIKEEIEKNPKLEGVKII
ncbi:MAG: uL15 family ribosomal protein [Candidatus Nanoarchaeia archaeon]|nr:uL15 family ribosomal protein [Candidatus Nanoarchaeia archaeon]